MESRNLTPLSTKTALGSIFGDLSRSYGNDVDPLLFGGIDGIDWPAMTILAPKRRLPNLPRKSHPLVFLGKNV